MDGMMVRQESLKLCLPKKVAVVGCGGVGSWTAYLLSLAGVESIYLFDFDTISESNLNRIPVPLDTVGVPKSQVVASLIATVRPKCEVIALGRFTKELAEKLNLAEEGIEWYVATTDSLKSRQEVHKWVSGNYWADPRPKYLEASAEGDYGGATGVPAEWATEEELNPGYASVPVWVGPCVSAALAAVSYIVHGIQMEDASVRLGWDGERNCFDAQLHGMPEVDTLEEEESEEDEDDDVEEREEATQEAATPNTTFGEDPDTGTDWHA